MWLLTSCLSLILTSCVQPEFARFSATLAEAPISVPGQLAIYYGWPSLVNGAAGDVDAATAAFEQFSTVVFGDGLEHPTHGDHLKTAQIIARLAPRVEVYGYIDMGITTQNLSLLKAQRYVDEWADMGVTGIFWDDAGRDYGVDRSRLNALVNYTHAKGLRVFINAWNPADVFAEDLGRVTVTAGDLYLAEGWLYAHDAYQNLTAWASKADVLLAYADNTGVRLAVVGTGRTDGDMAAREHPYQLVWWGGAMYGVQLVGYTDYLYSASGPGSNQLLLPPLPDFSYGSVFLQPGVDHGQNNTYHARPTDQGVIVVSGNGFSSGQGYFAPAFTLQGVVFVDNDGDGLRDVDEVPNSVPVPVELTHVETGEVLVDYSNRDGIYRFVELVAGDYAITAPSVWQGHRRTTEVPRMIHLGETGVYPGVDIGFLLPTGISSLADLTVEVVRGAVWVRWTASTWSGSGFIVWRAVGTAGLFTPISDVLPAETGLPDASYQWLDVAAPSGNRLWYQVETLPEGQRYGPVGVRFEPLLGAKTLIWFPIMLTARQSQTCRR